MLKIRNISSSSATFWIDCTAWNSGWTRNPNVRGWDGCECTREVWTIILTGLNGVVLNGLPMGCIGVRNVSRRRLKKLEFLNILSNNFLRPTGPILITYTKSSTSYVSDISARSYNLSNNFSTSNLTLTAVQKVTFFFQKFYKMKLINWKFCFLLAVSPSTVDNVKIT